jgi:phosphoenolpyruvate phosphomutase / 2-hydroxyethylphosphonate cytidylyltransferase
MKRTASASLYRGDEMALASVTLPERRRPLLRTFMNERRLLRAIECHDPLSALLGSQAEARVGKLQFDVLWASGFSHATMLGLPDCEMNALEHRIHSTADIAAVTAKPILADADTGGDGLALRYLCQRLEQIGVSGAVVEDKTGAKRTSLASGVSHRLEDPDAFVRKIEEAKQGLLSADFMIFARTESLIAGAGLDEAVKRAEIYLKSAADGLVIHSKDKSGAEVVAFMHAYRRLQSSSGITKPLVCIPTAYSHMKGSELHDLGAALVIHGNHMIRAAYRAMQSAARSILDHDRSLEADAVCAPLDEVLHAIGVGARSEPGVEPAVAERAALGIAAE